MKSLNPRIGGPFFSSHPVVTYKVWKIDPYQEDRGVRYWTNGLSKNLRQQPNESFHKIATF